MHVFVSRFEDYHQRAVAFCETAGRGHDTHILLYNDLCSIRATGSIICQAGGYKIYLKSGE